MVNITLCSKKRWENSKHLNGVFQKDNVQCYLMLSRVSTYSLTTQIWIDLPESRSAHISKDALDLRFCEKLSLSLFSKYLPCKYQMQLRRLTGSKLDCCPFGLRLKNGISNLQHCFIFILIWSYKQILCNEVKLIGLSLHIPGHLITNISMHI